jgi:hypothetical protein
MAAIVFFAIVAGAVADNIKLLHYASYCHIDFFILSNIIILIKHQTFGRKDQLWSE